MKIGCVKEIKNNEFRVGLTPDNVKSYVAAGHHVYIEMGAFLMRSTWRRARACSRTPRRFGSSLT